MNYGVGAGGQPGQYVPMPHSQMAPGGMQPQMMPMQMMPGAQTAGGMRAMYPQQPGMPQHMMRAGQPMYGAGHPMTPQQQAQHQAQQQMRMQINRLPPEWRKNIEMEQNPEKRKNLFQSYMAKMNAEQNARMPQHGFPQGSMPQGMAAQRMAPAGAASAAYPMTSSNAMGGPPMHHPGMAAGPQPGQPRMGAHGVAGGVPSPSTMAMGGGGVPMLGAMPNSASSGQLAANSPQVMATSMAANPQAHASPSTITNASPRLIPPHTPQNPNSVQQPSSAGGPGSQQAPASVDDDAKTPEYAALLKRIRDMYLDDLKKIIYRMDQDNVQRPSYIDRLVEILDYKRPVKLSLLEKTESTSRNTVHKFGMAFRMTEVLTRLERNGFATKEVVEEEEKPLARNESNDKLNRLDPWGAVRHMMIKVPDCVAQLYEDDNSMKTARKRVLTPNDEAPSAKKRTTGDAETPKIFKDLIGGAAPMQQSPLVTHAAPAIKVECFFDNRKQWEMPEAAARELASIPWQYDSDFLPSSSRSADALICFVPQLMMCPPLRVLVPQKYPLESAVVQYPSSFPASLAFSSILLPLFDRILAASPNRSLTCIFNAYKCACEELLKNGAMKVRGGSNNVAANGHRLQKQQVVA